MSLKIDKRFTSLQSKKKDNTDKKDNKHHHHKDDPTPTPTPTPTPNPEPTPTPTPDPSSNYLYNLPMTDLTDISQLTSAGFKYQWSYDQQASFSATNPNPKYFALGSNGLEINIYQNDNPFQKGSPTEPRTELRGTAVVKDNVQYVYSFDQFLVNLPNFDYAWCQVFGGNGPNIILRWRSGSMALLVDQGDHVNVKFSGTPNDDVGKWVNWKIEFMLSTSNGYVRLYRDNVLMATATGNNSGADNSYIKNGIYSQQMKPSNDVKMYKKNLMLYSL